MQQEFERLVELLHTLDPLGKDYKRIFHMIVDMRHMINMFATKVEECGYITPAKVEEKDPVKEEPKKEEPIAEPTPVAEPVQPAVVEEEPKKEEPIAEPTPVAEPVQPAVVEEEPKKEEPPQELTKEYVRGLLTETANKGISIKSIIEQFVPEGKDMKFSSVPASKYAELVGVLKNAG